MHAHAANATTIAFAISARCSARGTRSGDAAGPPSRLSRHRVGELADDQLVQADLLGVRPLREGGVQAFGMRSSSRPL